MKKTILKFLPQSLLRKWSAYKNKGKTDEAIFTEIYEKGLWGDAPDNRKYCSGSGTTDAHVALYQDKLIQFIHENQIKSIFEIGCGDFSIMQHVMQHVDAHYHGTDLVAPVIEYHKAQKYGQKHVFEQLNAVSAKALPIADICIIRQVLQHLSNTQILNILKKLNNFKYILITEHIPLSPAEMNGDKEPSGYIRLQNKKCSGVYITEPPFSVSATEWLSYRQDEIGFSGKIVQAKITSWLITNEQ